MALKKEAPYSFPLTPKGGLDRRLKWTKLTTAFTLPLEKELVESVVAPLRSGGVVFAVLCLDMVASRVEVYREKAKPRD